MDTVFQRHEDKFGCSGLNNGCALGGAYQGLSRALEALCLFFRGSVARVEACQVAYRGAAERDGEMILKAVSPSADFILLDEHGREYRSMDFSDFLQRKTLARRDAAFAVGGPYGFSPAVYECANGKISLIQMTFSHQMVRLFFVEQIYRAMTILRHEPYHHGMEAEYAKKGLDYTLEASVHKCVQMFEATANRPFACRLWDVSTAYPPQKINK